MCVCIYSHKTLDIYTNKHTHKANQTLSSLRSIWFFIPYYSIEQFRIKFPGSGSLDDLWLCVCVFRLFVLSLFFFLCFTCVNLIMIIFDSNYMYSLRFVPFIFHLTLLCIGYIVGQQLSTVHVLCVRVRVRVRVRVKQQPTFALTLFLKAFPIQLSF